MSANQSTKPKPPVNRRRKADEYRSRDVAVLNHVYRYGIGLNGVLSKAFFGGEAAGHVVRRFAAKNWLAVENAVIPGGISYGTLTPTGGKEIGRTVKAKKLGAVALDLAIAAAFFSVLATKERRYRLLPEEIKGLKAGLPPNVPYVVTEEFGVPVILRLQLAMNHKPAKVRDKTAELLAKAETNPKSAQLIHSKQLGIAVLGQTPEQVSKLEAAFSEDERFEGIRLVIGLGPTAETLAASLRQVRGKK